MYDAITVLLVVAAASAASNPTVTVTPLWEHRLEDDVPLTLAMGTGEGQPFLIGTEAGGVFIADREQTPHRLFEADGSVQAFGTLQLPGEGDAVVAGTERGEVLCVQLAAEGKPQTVWRHRASCGVTAVQALPDMLEDGVDGVAMGGADQEIKLLNGQTGRPIWAQDLGERGGSAYVHRIAPAGDLNGDDRWDLVVWTWRGELVALAGKDGTILWRARVNGGLVDAMDMASDANGDGRYDFVVGGNDATVKLCSGADGSVLWTANLDRTIRDVREVNDLNGDGTRDFFAVTAAGTVACIAGGAGPEAKVLWTANLGDVCRTLVCPGDVDGDDATDIVVGAENGIVAAFSGKNGRQVWQWQGPDVVREMLALPKTVGRGIDAIAVACLDGTVAVLPLRAGPSTEQPSPTSRPVATGHRFKPLKAALPAAEPVTEVPILLYHDVLPVAKYLYATSVDNFRAHMDLLVRGGYHCVTLDQVADWMAGKANLPERPICITFDGPYSGHHEHAFKILQERGLFAVSYITTDWIGTANHADWHELREMETAGVMDIQNHSMNHPSLSKVPRDEVVNQLRGCNESIARHLFGKAARHHAYPSGAENDMVCEVIRELGFVTATICRNARARRNDNVLRLNRYVLQNDTSLDQFKTWIRFAEPTVD
ncbi:MAG: polysaccharide deacetylase family protein [Phycisphaerae bacterium]|nr:polysaccharide deacetylase family protein [Phycisphaerae bacterium]